MANISFMIYEMRVLISHTQDFITFIVSRDVIITRGGSVHVVPAEDSFMLHFI